MYSSLSYWPTWQKILVAAAMAASLYAGYGAHAAEGEVYTKKVENGFSKFEALKLLLSSDNKATVYKCVLVEASSKGAVKNK